MIPAVLRSAAFPAEDDPAIAARVLRLCLLGEWGMTRALLAKAAKCILYLAGRQSRIEVRSPLATVDRREFPQFCVTI